MDPQSAFPQPGSPLEPTSAAQPILPQPGQASAAVAAASPAAPAVAVDNDVIEPAWVNQAERIVAQTAFDPHEQAQALAALKADYMQKRYAKVVKVEQD